MRLETFGQSSVYCSSIDSTSGEIVVSGPGASSGYWPPDSKIAGSYETEEMNIVRVFFRKTLLDLPNELQQDTFYFLRKNGSIVKIYETFFDAQSQTNQINFSSNASGSLFLIYFPDFAYRYLKAWSPAADSIPEIPCCPHVPLVFKDCPNLGTITYMGETRQLKRFNAVNENIYAPASLNSFTAIEKQYTDSQQQTWNLKIWISLYFDFYPFPVENNPYGISGKPSLIIYFKGKLNLDPQQEIANFIIFKTEQNFSTNITFNLTEPLPESNAELAAQGFLPSTLSVSLSGAINPPDRIRVYMPDAYFQNDVLNEIGMLVNKPINLGLIDEVLTFDPDTLTYWGEKKTRAGIPGRMQFTIPNFYPLLSSNKKFIDCYANYGNQSWNTTHWTQGSELDYECLNGWANSEFYFYPTFFNAKVQIDINDIYVSGLGFTNLYSAADQFGGYPTNLPLGSTWFDTRVVQNLAPTSDEIPDNRKRKNVFMFMVFSRWGDAKYRNTNGVYFEQKGPNVVVDHFHQNMYYIKSVHPDAYITSLGL